MYTIDIILKMSPIPVSVQRKDEESAQALYQSITEAMQEANPKLLELTCDKQPDKKVAIFSNQISAVVVSQKTGAAAAGRAPGFLAIGEL
ncbi:hypothetical protein [Gloeothece verrucosa]|uniref:UPF0367 protein Cyan7822_5533 n=1 Tax=Gloeothece verrucosa (strain PCC 7822) TaxID=497965 RepID=E0UAA1_GLOV7|nr:hypothetical protein [Gloeothece verrucosa]ADN17406.1 conserved hypothetical protein [Gloeothece verrucosa PCC 7822]